MIVRATPTSFVCIAQHDHAQVSGVLAGHWQRPYFEGIARRPEVLLAIQEHDRAWIPLDAAPLWNEQTQAPYSFLDYPAATRLEHYQQGITEVEHLSPYAGLLCSLHYTSFSELARHSLGQQFLAAETQRQNRLRQALQLTEPPQATELEFHRQLLKFTDNLSLYLCLNEPGHSRAQEHPWFQAGIPASDVFAFTRHQFIRADWPTKPEVRVYPFPFAESFPVTLRYQELPRNQLKAIALGQRFQQAPVQELEVRITPGLV